MDTRFDDADGRSWTMFGSVLMRLHWREARWGFTCFRGLGLTVNVIVSHGDERCSTESSVDDYVRCTLKTLPLQCSSFGNRVENRKSALETFKMTFSVSFLPILPLTAISLPSLHDALLF